MEQGEPAAEVQAAEPLVVLQVPVLLVEDRPPEEHKLRVVAKGLPPGKQAAPNRRPVKPKGVQPPPGKHNAKGGKGPAAKPKEAPHRASRHRVSRVVPPQVRLKGNEDNLLPDRLKVSRAVLPPDKPEAIGAPTIEDRIDAVPHARHPTSTTIATNVTTKPTAILAIQTHGTTEVSAKIIALARRTISNPDLAEMSETAPLIPLRNNRSPAAASACQAVLNREVAQDYREGVIKMGEPTQAPIRGRTSHRS